MNDLQRGQSALAVEIPQSTAAGAHTPSLRVVAVLLQVVPWLLSCAFPVRPVLPHREGIMGLRSVMTVSPFSIGTLLPCIDS
jgi:hypothetical protein